MNISNDFKYHFVYKTTCLVNGKRYIGKHSTNNLNDGYLGSGVVLKKAIAKYGVDAFERKILRMCDTLEECMQLEALLVDETIIESDEYYNLKCGGFGGVYSQEVKDKISKKASGRIMSPESIEKGLATRLKNGGYATGERHHMYGKSHTPEVAAKLAATLRRRYKSGEIVTWNKGLSIRDMISEDERKKYGRDTAGELNPSYGSKWLGNVELGVKCYIKNNDKSLEEALKSKGWVEKPKKFNSLTSVTKTIQDYL